MSGSYLKLDSGEVAVTAMNLRRRIEDRFPDSGLSRVCRDLEVVAFDAGKASRQISKPNWTYRFSAIALWLMILLSVVAVLSQARFRPDLGGVSDFLQGIQALIEVIVYAGASCYFLIGLELRRKRSLVLNAMHVLRSLAHVIDMHQLTKDPNRFDHDYDTIHSPVRNLNAFELKRYLEYCSEMLAIVSKVAAVYVQGFPDTEAADAASDIEALTNGLSRKVWLKIDAVHDLVGAFSRRSMIQKNAS